MPGLIKWNVIGLSLCCFSALSNLNIFKKLKASFVNLFGLNWWSQGQSQCIYISFSLLQTTQWHKLKCSHISNADIKAECNILEWLRAGAEAKYSDTHVLSEGHSGQGMYISVFLSLIWTFYKCTTESWCIFMDSGLGIFWKYQVNITAKQCHVYQKISVPYIKNRVVNQPTSRKHTLRKDITCNHIISSSSTKTTGYMQTVYGHSHIRTPLQDHSR